MKTQSLTRASSKPQRSQLRRPAGRLCFTLLAGLLLIRPPLAAGASQTNLIVRLYYGDRSHLDQLVRQYDVFEFADHVAGYVAARLSPEEYDALVQAGYHLELDAEQTALANRSRIKTADQADGIPSFTCYRTVEETYATLAQIAADYPDLATLVDIGDSWEKTTPGGAAGYDLLVLILSNKSRPQAAPLCRG